MEDQREHCAYSFTGHRCDVGSDFLFVEGQGPHEHVMGDDRDCFPGRRVVS